MRIFVLLVLFFRFLMSDVNESNEVFLKLDTGGHNGLIKDIIVTKSGDIISASEDKTIRIWDSKTGKELRKILGEIGVGGRVGKIFAIALSPDEKFLVVGGMFVDSKKIKKQKYEEIRVYRYKTGKLIKVLKSHTNVIFDLSFSSDGKYFISGSGDRTAKIWNTLDFTLKDTIELKDSIYAVKIITNDGHYYAVTAGFDNELSLYSLESKKILKSHNLEHKLMFLAISKKHIAVCGFNNQTIEIFNYNLKKIKTVYSETKPAGLSYSKDDKLLIVGQGGIPYNINIYNTKNYNKITSFKKHENVTTAVGFFNNEIAISGGGNDNEIYLWDIKTRKIQQKLSRIEGVISFFGKEDSNKLPLVSGQYSLTTTKGGVFGYESAILEIRKKNKVMHRIIRNRSSGIVHRIYGFHENTIISGGANGILKIYNFEGKEIANLIGHIGEIFTFSIDKNILVTGGTDQIVRTWDLNKLKKQKRKINEKFLLEAMKELNYSRKQVMDIVKKNKINIYLAPKIQNLYSQFNSFHIPLNLTGKDMKEWIMWTNEGYFISSIAENMKYIYFHLNQGADKEAKAIPMKSLYDYFHRPDLIKLKSIGLEEFYQEAIKGMSYQKALKDPPPTIKSKNTNKKTNQEKTKLFFNIQDNSGGIGIIRIYQEGKLVQTIGEGKIEKQSSNLFTILKQEVSDIMNKENQTDEKLTKLLKSKNGTLDINDTVGNQKIITITNKAGDYEIELELISGQNEIGIEAFNKTNTVTSYRETIVIDADIPKKKPKLYAIVVGVDNFEVDKQESLKYAEKDALSIQKEIETKMGKTFDEVEVKSLIGEDVTRANILKSAKEIAQKAKLEDTIIFYISTHGRAAKGNLYFAPYNNEQGSDWIDFDQTFKAIQSIKALNQIFIVDACESGQANDIVSAVYDSRASVLARSAGVHMLLATTKGAFAYEPNDKSKNVMTFTQRILKTLRDKASDKNGDGFVSVVELSKSLKEPQNVVEYQYPVIRNVGGDVLLRRVE